MLYPYSRIKVLDNSGGKTFQIIHILYKGGFGKVGTLSNFVVGSIKSLRKKNKYLSKVKKGSVIYGILIKTKQIINRKNGLKIQFFLNGIVLTAKNKTPIGTRIFSTIPKELRLKKYSKFISLSLKYI